MAEYVARERLYHTADRSEVVKEGDPKAAFLLVPEGERLSESEVKRLKLESYFEAAEAVDPNVRTKARLEDALARGAAEEAVALEGALHQRELVAAHGGTERVVLERGRAGQATAGVPTPPATKAATGTAPKPAPAPRPAPPAPAPASAPASAPAEKR